MSLLRPDRVYTVRSQSESASVRERPTFDPFEKPDSHN